MPEVRPAGTGFAPDERHFVLLFLPVALGFGGRMAMVTFNGPLARLFTDNGYLIGFLLALGPLVAALLNPLVGRLSDGTWTRLGRRLPYALVGVPLSALILFAIPWAPGYGVLLALFLLRAVLISFGGVPLLSLIPDQIAAARRGRAMSLFLVAGGVGAIVVQLSGKLYWDRDFAQVFYVAGALGLLLTVPPLFWIRERRPAPAVLAAARQRRGLSPGAMGRALARGDAIALFLVAASLRYLGTGLVVTYLTLFAATDLGVRVSDAALVVAIASGVRLLLAVPSGRLVDSRDRRDLLLAATLVLAAVHLATALGVQGLAGLTAVLLVGAVAGTLEMTASGPLFMDLQPPDQIGELTGINLVLTNVFQAAGALLGGAIFAWTASYRPGYAIAALCFAASAAVLARMAPQTAPGGGASGRPGRASRDPD